MKYCATTGAERRQRRSLSRPASRPGSVNVKAIVVTSRPNHDTYEPAGTAFGGPSESILAKAASFASEAPMFAAVLQTSTGSTGDAPSAREIVKAQLAAV